MTKYVKWAALASVLYLAYRWWANRKPVGATKTPLQSSNAPAQNFWDAGNQGPAPDSSAGTAQNFWDAGNQGPV